MELNQKGRMEKKPKENVKKKVLLSLLILCVIAVLGVGGWFLYKGLQYNTYFNEKQGFRIKYPKTWSVSRKIIPGMIAGFVSPKENALDLFLENVAITKRDLSKKPMTLDEYTASTVKQMTLVFKNLKAEPAVDLELSGHPAKKVILRAAGGEGSVVVIYAFVFEKKAYNITYMGTAVRYPKDQLILTDMVNSLKVYF